MSRTRQEENKQREQLGWGLFMMAIGVVILLVQSDVLPDLFGRDWWPYLIVAFGLVSIVTARDPKALGWGVTVLGTGLWIAAAVNHWYGLGWSSGWPLALVAAGLGSLVEWAATVVEQRRQKENGHVS